jgi:hypothetical protein
VTTAWRDLSRYEQCVLVAASSGDGSGLPWILSSWDPWWQPDDLASYSEELTAAISTLMAGGLVVVTDGMLAGDPAMSIEAVGRAATHPRNWFYGDEGLEQVLWVTTTDAGDRVGAAAPSADVLRYVDPRRNPSERCDTPLDHG